MEKTWFLYNRILSFPQKNYSAIYRIHRIVIPEKLQPGVF